AVGWSPPGTWTGSRRGPAERGQPVGRGAPGVARDAQGTDRTPEDGARPDDCGTRRGDCVMRETVSERYRKTLPGSWARWERARRVIPGGITHDGRHLTPFPLYIERAAGPRKWDVDGREYIDYWMGHGALF